jgi:hypothetical protein
MKNSFSFFIIFLCVACLGTQAQTPPPILSSASADQQIEQAPTLPTAWTTTTQPTSLYINRLDNIRFASQFASGSSTGGIQEAINDLPQTGGLVMLPIGITKAYAQISINKPVVLRGQGMGGISNANFSSPPDTQWSTPSVIQSQMTGSQDVIEIQPLAIGSAPPSQYNDPPSTGYLGGVVLEDFQVQGNLSGSGGCGIGLIGGNGNSNNQTGIIQLQQVVISRVTSRDNGDCGLKVQDAAFMVTIRDSQVVKNVTDGIHILSTGLGQPSQIWLYGVISDMNGRDGLRVEGNCGDVSVFGGTFSDSTNYGLGVYSGAGSGPGGTVYVYGAHFESNSNSGISLGAGSGHVISGNTIESNNHYGYSAGIVVWTQTGGRAAILLGNQLQNNTTDIAVGSGSTSNPTMNVVIGPQATKTYTYNVAGGSSAVGTQYLLMGSFPSGSCSSGCVDP